MEFNKYINRQVVIRIAVVLVFLLIAFLCYDNLLFRLKGSSPSFDSFPDSSTEIRLKFSQPIKSIGAVSLNDEDIDVTIDGRVVTIPLGNSLESGNKYNLELSDIRSEWFDNSFHGTTHISPPRDGYRHPPQKERGPPHRAI